MSGKKNTQATTSGDQPALKIGSRVRCTDDGVTGRIAWANAVSVKIKWDDGEEVTWKRASLADRPIEILDTEDATEQVATAEPVTTIEQAAAPEQPVADCAPIAPTPVQDPAAKPAAAEPRPAPAEPTIPVEHPVAEPAQPTAATASLATVVPEMPTPAPAKPKRQRQSTAATEPKEKKLSALDAAAKVLGESGQAMTTQEMIDAMALKGYWSPPGGQTPAATLYSALLRELKTKGDQARFLKAAPGRFALRALAGASSP